MTATKSLTIGWTPAGSAEIAAGRISSIGTAIDNTATESQMQFKAVTAFTLANFGLRVITNTVGSPGTYHSRIGAANGNLAVTPTGNTTGWFSDTTHSDSISATNLVDWSRIGGVITLSLFCFNTQASSPFAVWMERVQVNLPTSQGFSWPFAGLTAYTVAGSDAYTQTVVRCAGTWKSLSLNINTNSGTDTIKSRVGGADGNQVISTSSTGIVQDTTHSDSITSGNLLNISVQTSASSNVFYLSSEFAGTTSAQDVGAVSSGAGVTGVSFTASTTYYACPYGGLSTSTTEVNNKLNCPYALTLSRPRIYVHSNSSSTMTVTARKNGSDGNAVVSVSSGATGEMEDTTHSDSFASADDLNFSLVVGAGGNVALRSLRTLLDDGSNTGSSTETGTAVMSMAGIAYVASGGRNETGSATMAMQGIAYAGSGSVIHVKGTAVMALAGVSIRATAFELGAAGQGVRQFWTF